jgi:hypothetical protein
LALSKEEKTMKSFLTNWKTSASGAALVLGAVSDALTQASNGTWDGNRLMADFTAFAGGIGLIFAKDGNVTGGTIRQ